MNVIRQAPSILAWLFLASLFQGGQVARAAEISAGISARETYVGLAVTLQIQLRNVSDYQPPQVADVDGLIIESAGTPSQRSQISIINGRRSQSTSVTFLYRVTPQRPGAFTIPPVTVHADGTTHTTKSVQLIATKSETGDLMFVEVEGKQESIYVGEPLDMTLKIWIRPFRDQQQRVVLSEADMWRLISDQSNWGPFAERLQELAKQNKRPGGQEVLREDSEGDQRSYYLYELDSTVYPQRPGRVDGDEIRLIVKYPTKLGRTRDPFSRFFNDDAFPFQSNLFDDGLFQSAIGSRLSITAVRPIIADAVVEPINVKPIPTAGRPPDYRGAVGQFQIRVAAKPTKVNAGDPITLHVEIEGTGRMDLIQAPPIAEFSELAADFKVPQESLAGIVDAATKTFSTSVRPRRAGIKQIPGIPFSYFDPQQESFVTVRSEPIEIDVGQAETLALETIVDAREDQPGSAAVAQSAEPLMDNHTGLEVLQSEASTVPFERRYFSLFALPPLLFACFLLLVRRSAWASSAQWLRSPSRQLKRSIARAESAAEIAAACSQFVHDRLRSKAPVQSEVAAIGALRQAGQRDLAVELERLVGACHASSRTGGTEGLAELREQASGLADLLIAGLSRFGRQPRVRPSGSGVSTTVTLMLLIFPAALLDPQSVSAAEETGKSELAVAVFGEANELYRQACEMADGQSEASRDLAGRAAAKYQFLVDSGITNSKLYFNLANAYQRSDQRGRAIANYHRALRLNPTDRRAAANLRLMQPPATATSASGLLPLVSNANESLTRWIHPKLIGLVMFVAWTGIWTALAIRLFRPLPWKTVVTMCLSVLAIAATSYALTTDRLADSYAVMVNPQVEFRSGDGANFPAIQTLEEAEGRTYRILHLRGDWIQVSTSSGQTGWIRADCAEIL